MTMPTAESDAVPTDRATPRNPHRRPPPPPRAAGTGAARAALLLILALLPAACGEPPDAGGGLELPPPRTYVVRGEVTRLADGGATLFLRHEPIDDFVDVTGRTSGMDSMVMPFPLAADVSAAGVEPGDVVEVTLEVDWGAEAPARVTALEELPAGTELELGPAEPQPGTGTGTGTEEG